MELSRIQNVQVFRRGSESDTTERTPIAKGRFGPDFEMDCVRFEVSRGAGKSYYERCIQSEDFGALALAMMRASAETALKAFGEALQAGIPEQVEKTQWTPRIA
jgi:hypothetical protein